MGQSGSSEDKNKNQFIVYDHESEHSGSFQLQMSELLLWNREECTNNLRGLPKSSLLFSLSLFLYLESGENGLNTL